MHLLEPEMSQLGAGTGSRGSTSLPLLRRGELRSGPVFASIGTVLIDGFDIPPRPSLDTQTPGITSPPSPTHSSSSHFTSPLNSNSLSSSISTSSSTSFSTISSANSLAQYLISRTGALTPQREFETDDTGPSGRSPVSSPNSNSSKRRAAKARACAGSTTIPESQEDNLVVEADPPPSIDTDHHGGSSGSGSVSELGSGSAHASIGSLSEPIDVLGGGALYALVGARMWLPPGLCRALVDTDTDRADLSEELERELEGYGKGCWGYLEGEGRKMIRSRIRYEGTVRLYKHVIRPQHRSFASLLDTPIDGSAYLHIAPPYAPEDVATLLRGQRAFAMAKGRIWSPKIVYEPSPHGCHTGQQSFLEEILPDTEVLSPNHEELLSLYGHPLHSLSSPLLRPALEEVMKHLLDLGIGTDGSGIVAVRCGRLGSVVGTRKDGLRWIPAYWEKADEYMVKDVTGGGNAYLGGYIAGLHASNGDAYEAALYGTISASFTVEQIGLPRLRITAAVDQEDQHGMTEGMDLRPECLRGEVWNGEVPELRLADFRKRLKEREESDRLAGEQEQPGQLDDLRAA